MRLPLFRCAYALALVAAFLHLSSALLCAQAGQAELSGEVRDEAGAVVSGAQVTIKEAQTDNVLTATTRNDGLFTFTNLKPGLYTLSIETRGFKRFTREGVRLATGERVRFDVNLMVGSPDETVTVRADASLLRTATGSLGQVITHQKIVGR